MLRLHRARRQRPGQVRPGIEHQARKSVAYVGHIARFDPESFESLQQRGHPPSILLRSAENAAGRGSVRIALTIAVPAPK
jgi:hypothetical protein